VIARIEGTGIKEPSKEAKVANLNFLRNPKKFLQDKIDKKLDSMTKSGKTPFGTNVGGSAVGEEGLGRFGNPNELSDASTTRFGNQFSPSVEVASADLSGISVGDSFTKRAESNLADTKLASAGSDSSSTFNENDFQGYMKALDIKRPRALPPTMIRMLKENYKDDVRDGRYVEGQLINKAPVEKKPTIGERVANFTGGVFNALTGTQSAVAQTKETGEGLFNKNVPSDAYSTSIKPQYQINREQNRPLTSSNLDAAKAVQRTVDTGDTSFSSYRMGGGEKQQEGSGIVTPFSQTSMGQGESRKVTPFSETSMGQLGSIPKTSITTPKTVTVDGQTVAARQTVASLPSNYKATEAEAFRKAAAFKEAQGIAKRNPNVSVGVDSKGQPKATATNDSGEARAQAAAVNRKLAGKSISQVKAANRESMRAAAAERQATFKKTGKSTVGARRAAAKASMKAKAKARHASFKKKRAAKAAARRRRRGRRGRRCDIFLKYNISPLMNMNLIRDDLAEVAYFVKEIQK
jgi:hypothetical protein